MYGGHRWFCDECYEKHLCRVIREKPERKEEEDRLKSELRFEYPDETEEWFIYWLEHLFHD